MATNKISILFIILLSIIETTASAHDLKVKNADGVTIFYNYINDGKELEVTYDAVLYRNSYEGDVKVPEEVTYLNNTRKVTSIGENAFADCSNLTSVTIPNGITIIKKGAFSNCTKLTSFTIPNSVTKIENVAFFNCEKLTYIILPPNLNSIGYDRTFERCDFQYIISQSEEPPTIGYEAFNKNTRYNAILYVPIGTIEKYKKAGWSCFEHIEEGDGSGIETPDYEICAKPTIIYQNGKLSFHSSTEGVTFQYSISDSDIKSGSAHEIELGVTYNISVYATKPGYNNSAVATAALCWIDFEPNTEGITGVASVRASAVLIQSDDGFLTISGADEGTPITIYNTAGQLVGSAKSSAQTTHIGTTLRNGEIGIVKIGEKAVKVLMK